MKRKRRQQRFKEYKYATPSKEEQFSLCDAMRCVLDILFPVFFLPFLGLFSLSQADAN